MIPLILLLACNQIFAQSAPDAPAPKPPQVIRPLVLGPGNTVGVILEPSFVRAAETAKPAAKKTPKPKCSRK